MVGMQQFNLRWNNYTSNILQVFSEHLSSESLVDVTLSCQGRFIKAHKIILSACSSYFQEVFANHTAKHPVIILKGIKYEDMQSMIKFMYNGEIRVQEAQLDDLLAAAELLQVKGLSNVRSKYERGEITSLQPAPKLVPVKPTNSAAVQKEPQTPAIKGKVVGTLFGPTVTTTRAPNTVATALAIATPLTKTRAQSAGEAMTVIPVSTFHAANANTRTGTSASVTPTLAIAIPVSKPTSTYRNIAPATTSSLPTKTSTPITVSAKAKNPTNSTPISSTSTTPSLNTPIITCVTGNFVDHSDSKPVGNVISATNSTPIAQLFRLPTIYTFAASASGTTATTTTTTTTAQPPKVRKRRKTSHVVNELAKEAVFASNGTVLLEPDDAIVKNQTTTSNSSLSLRTEGLDTSAEVEEITVKKMRVKIQSKNPQESLLIKDRGNKSEKIPRPPNAFMIFANEWRRKLAVEYPKETNKKISVRLGIMWKALSIKSKETYYKLAKKADHEHKLKYPHYFYSPKEARIRKTLRHDRILRKSLPARPENSNELQMLKAYVNSEDREIIEFTDSSEYEDEYNYEACEEEDEEEEMGEEEEEEKQEQVVEQEEYDDDMILEYSEEEDNPHETSQSSSKQKNSTSSNKMYTAKT